MLILPPLRLTTSPRVVIWFWLMFRGAVFSTVPVVLAGKKIVEYAATAGSSRLEQMTFRTPLQFI